MRALRNKVAWRGVSSMGIHVFISHADDYDVKAIVQALTRCAEREMRFKVSQEPANIVHFSGHGYADEKNDGSSSRLLILGLGGSGKTSLMSRLVRRVGVKQLGAHDLTAGEHWRSALSRTMKEPGRLIILIDGFSENVHPWEAQTHRWRVAETSPPSSSIGRALCHSIDTSLNGDARSQTCRLLIDAMLLMNHASLDSAAPKTALWSALAHERAHEVVTDIGANPLFWLDEQEMHHKEAATHDGSLARLLIPQGVFLANRILAYPSERYPTFGRNQCHRWTA